jgi:hypothetical protein
MPEDRHRQHMRIRRISPDGQASNQPTDQPPSHMRITRLSPPSTQPPPLAPASTVLGKHPATNEYISIDDISRCSGCYVIGTQGVGKSSLLEHMIYQDIEKHYAVIVLDPHGQLIENIIARMHASHLSRTYFLDLTDDDYPFGFNIFTPSESRREPTITINRVMSIFEKLWPSETRGLFLPMLLQNVTETLIEHADTMTIADIPALLLDADYRAEKVARLKDKRLKEYWELEYDTNSASTQRRETAPLRTRLNRWLNDRVITNVLCQQRATIDFRQAIERREILLIKLPINQPGFENASEIIGTMILSQIYAATFSFADTPEEKRSGYSLYIDEFQKFASSDTARLFTEGRKYKVRQTLAHQTRTQLTLKEVASATVTANTVIAFRTEPGDSSELARVFSDLDLFPQLHIHRGDIFPHMKKHRNPSVSNFWARYIRRWEEADNKSAKTDWPRANLGHGFVEYHPNRVKAVLSMVEELFYIAMREQRIDDELSGSLLSKVGAWYNEEATNQFITNLSQTICALRDEPIGEKEPTDKADIEAHLLHLPNRQALARIQGTTTYQLTTLPLRPRVAEYELTRRIDRLQHQTRKKYCRPRTEIAAEADQDRISQDTEADIENDVYEPEGEPEQRAPDDDAQEVEIAHQPPPEPQVQEQPPKPEKQKPANRQSSQKPEPQKYEEPRPYQRFEEM